MQKALAYGSQIHPHYRTEFDSGVAWHRSPFTVGCHGMWSEESRDRHYDDLCKIDGRMVLAGEHASYLPGWQEGAVTSALDAMGACMPTPSRKAPGAPGEPRTCDSLSLASHACSWPHRCSQG